MLSYSGICRGLKTSSKAVFTDFLHIFVIFEVSNPVLSRIFNFEVYVYYQLTKIRASNPSSPG